MSYTCLIPIISFFILFYFILIWVYGYGFGSGGGGCFSWILGGGSGYCAVGEGVDFCVVVGLFVLLLLLFFGAMRLIFGLIWHLGRSIVFKYGQINLCFIRPRYRL